MDLPGINTSGSKIYQQGILGSALAMDKQKSSELYQYYGLKLHIAVSRKI